jgi:hypothetical protein
MTLTADLFLTKEQALENWCRQKVFFSKADLYDYSLRQFYLRADRTVRDWVVEGKVRHLSKDECIFRNLKGKMAWYEFVR